jgi:hypothetical protein
MPSFYIDVKENDAAMLLYKSRDEDGSILYEIVASRARHDSHCDFCVTYANFMVCHGRSSPKDKEPHRERRENLQLDGAVDSLPAALLRKPSILLPDNLALNMSTL